MVISVISIKKLVKSLLSTLYVYEGLVENQIVDFDAPLTQEAFKAFREF